MAKLAEHQFVIPLWIQKHKYLVSMRVMTSEGNLDLHAVQAKADVT